MEEGCDDRIFRFEDECPPADAFYEYTEALKSVPIVVDNGKRMNKILYDHTVAHKGTFHNISTNRSSIQEFHRVIHMITAV
jgi:hypothetical protein